MQRNARSSASEHRALARVGGHGAIAVDVGYWPRWMRLGGVHLDSEQHCVVRLFDSFA